MDKEGQKAMAKAVADGIKQEREERMTEGLKVFLKLFIYIMFSGSLAVATANAGVGFITFGALIVLIDILKIGRRKKQRSK